MKKGLLSTAGFFLFLAGAAQKDISWDIKTGNQAALLIEQQVGLVRLPAGEEVVKAIGQNLVKQLETNPFTFSFQIVDQEEPNAFALPGGHVYVSRGLLALVKTEDELAGVIGHEISHVIKRHSARQKRTSILPAILATPGIIVGGTIGGKVGDAVAAPLLGAGQLLLSSYSRKQESEADALGIELAAKAGYRPATLSDILHRIELIVQAQTGKATSFNLFNDHPMTPERMKNISTLSSKLVPASKPTLFAHDEFLSRFNRLLYGPNPSKGLFSGSVYVNPLLKIYWELPTGWKYANQDSFVGATNGKEQMILGIAGRDTKIDTLIENFVNGYYAQTRYKPISDKTLKMTGRDGSEVIISGSDRRTILYTVWFKKDKHTYVVLASGPMDAIEAYRKCVQSFRDLSPADLDLISILELSIVQAREGETLEGFSKRAGNQLNLKFTAIVNGVPETHRAGPGELLKSVVKVPYR